MQNIEDLKLYIQDYIKRGRINYEACYLNLKDLETIVQALESVSHLKGRPCEACDCHTEKGCSKWVCIFSGFEDKEG